MFIKTGCSAEIHINARVNFRHAERIFIDVVGGGDLCADVDGSKWTTYDR